jgi:hypothetical protein
LTAAILLSLAISGHAWAEDSKYGVCSPETAGSENCVQVEKKQKPPIVDHFACSDYCPGPREKYMVKIYKGIKDPAECRGLGGRPLTYVGWGKHKICIVE